MQKVGGWIITGLAVLSLVWCLETAVTWVRSYGSDIALSQTRYLAPDTNAGTDTTPQDSKPTSIEQISAVHFNRGEVIATRGLRQVKSQGDDTGWEWIHNPPMTIDLGSSFWNGCGFAIQTRQDPGVSSVSIFFPMWAVMALALVLPIRWIMRFRKKRTDV